MLTRWDASLLYAFFFFCGLFFLSFDVEAERAKSVHRQRKARAKEPQSRAKAVVKSASAQGKARARQEKKTPLERLAYWVRIGDAGLQRRAARLMRKQQEGRAWAYMVGLLRLKRPAWRRGGVIAMGELGIPWTGELLLPMLRDPDLEVRQAVILSLGQLRGKEAVPALVESLRKAQGSSLTLLVRALAQIGEKSAVQAVEALTEGQKKALGSAYSLFLSSFGNRERQARWAALWKEAPERVIEAVGGWPHRWARQFLMKRWGSATPAQRLAMLRVWRTQPEGELADFLAARCREGAAPPAFCRNRGGLRAYQAAVLPPYPSVPKPFFMMDDAAIKAWLARLHQEERDPEKRFERITAQMRGMPYRFDALGEGEKGRIDRDPIFSLKRLDCVTFLEEAIAMTQHASLEKAIEATQQIRYIDGKIHYAHRKHLPMLQWIPSLIAEKIAVDITRKVGGEQTLMVEKTVTRESYLSSREGKMMARRIGLKRLPVGQYRLDYLLMQVAADHAQKIPHATILSFLMPSTPQSPFQITHQGVVIWREGRPYIRHASSYWGSIVEAPLEPYLRMRHFKPRIGVHLLRLLFSP